MLHVKQRMMRLATEGYCPLYWRWSVSTTGTPVRQWASRCQGRGRWPKLRWLFALLLSVTWPLRLLYLIGQTGWQFAPVIAQRMNMPVWRQILAQLWLGLTHALPPESYYMYELYRPERRGWVNQFVHQYEAGALFACLNQDQPHPAIADKAQFAQLCAQHHLPTVPILGICSQGVCNWQAPVGEDMFVKPLCGARGEGTRRWQLLTNKHYQDQDGQCDTWAAVAEELEMLSRQQVYLVQPCLTNHPAIARFSPGALCTVRIVTGRTPLGAIKTVAATFKMAWQPAIINTHGLNSPVDLGRGRLGRAYSYDPICPGYATHPVTGALLEGAVLPDWQIALTLAHQAHRLFPEYVFLGWDVALTPQGPVLLEGNAGWDVVTVQKPQGVPLAQTCFGDICRLWLLDKQH